MVIFNNENQPFEALVDMKNFKTISIGFFLVLIFVLATAAAWLYSRIDGALPILEGKKTLYGLSEQITVERDQQGIATFTGKNRNDIAIAVGFVHAQERFFQMDLLRRNSAGELSSLFGEVALDYDKSIRRHRFRERARRIVSQLPKDQYAILKAYTRGVNQGLDALSSAPFEYLLLQQPPLVWQEEDSVLTVLSMYIDLQYHDGRRERTLGAMKSALSEEVFNFLNPLGSQWDAAIDGTTLPSFPLPEHAWPAASAKNFNIDNHIEDLNDSYLTQDKEQFPGSNNWAVAGSISKHSSAIVSNDMHLSIRVPNTWYRASFKYPIDDETIQVTGVTLPGVPNIVVGSNGHIAWGFTNSYGDWSDIITLKLHEDKSQYLTPQGYQPFTTSTQMIAIKDKESVEVEIKETIWGPVIGENAQGDLLVYRWIAHDVEAVNLHHTKLETAKNVDEAFQIASKAGIPAQNMMIGDKQGNIGWTIMGPIPLKKGNIGDVPSDWSTGENGWDGFASFDQYPRVKNPESNRLWTANSRVVGNDMYKVLGNGGYALGARAQQIRDRLMSKVAFDEKDLLNIALDDEALFLKRWHKFINTNVLTDIAIEQNPSWAEVRSILDTEKLHARTDSVAYRIVTNFRLNVRNTVFEDFNNHFSDLDEGYRFSAIRHQIETPLWELVTKQPDNFMWLPKDNWSLLFEDALSKTLADMTIEQPLSEATWGLENKARIQHPLSKAIPFFGSILDMPQDPLPGDGYIPRVDGQGFGASERMIVSPGQEENGILHMPTSQAGHPWSPYFGKGHQDWVQGNPSPFLPGKTKYTLTLVSY